MAEPTPGDLSLDAIYAGAKAAGHPEAILAWRWRLARARVRHSVAESQLRRLTSLEVAGREIKLADVHAVEQELGDAAGCIDFCREMLKGPISVQMSGNNGGRK